MRCKRKARSRWLLPNWRAARQFRTRAEARWLVVLIEEPGVLIEPVVLIEHGGPHSMHCAR